MDEEAFYKFEACCEKERHIRFNEMQAEIARLRKAIVWCLRNGAEFSGGAIEYNFLLNLLNERRVAPCGPLFDEWIATVCRLAGGE